MTFGVVTASSDASGNANSSGEPSPGVAQLLFEFEVRDGKVWLHDEGSRGGPRRLLPMELYETGSFGSFDV